MTTVPFVPSVNSAFQFSATFDGSACTVIVTWNVSRNGYYVSLFDATQTRVFTMPLIGSPPDYDISLTAGYFKTMLIFRQATQTFEVV